jgi:CobQ-like glutamine amidotransferase family enzyme
MSALTFEMLFPEVANLHGDNANIGYLAQCRPDARVIRTGLNDRPAFLDERVDLLYLGPLTERAQLKAIDRLRPHRDALEARIASGALTLFTHNAFEVLGTRIRNDDMGYDEPALGILELDATLAMMGRYSGKVMGTVPELDAAHPIVGYKSQFSMVDADAALGGFLTADRGIGRHRGTAVEGVRRGGLIGTSLIGPLLVMNPHFTRALLSRLDPDAEPVLAHEEFAIAAYDARLAEFRDDRRWHPGERVQKPIAAR